RAQRGRLASPGPPEPGEPVQQQDQPAVPALRDVEPGAVGADRPVRPRSVEIDRRVAVCGHGGYLTGAGGGALAPSPRRSSARSSWTVLRVLGRPPSRFIMITPMPTAMPASRTHAPAVIRKDAQPQMPSAIRP